MTVSDLTQGAEYSFTVAGIVAGGTVGEESVLAQVITLDSKLIHEHHCYKCKTYIKYRYLNSTNNTVINFMNIAINKPQFLFVQSTSSSNIYICTSIYTRLKLN